MAYGNLTDTQKTTGWLHLGIHKFIQVVYKQNLSRFGTPNRKKITKTKSQSEKQQEKTEIRKRTKKQKTKERKQILRKKRKNEITKKDQKRKMVETFNFGEKKFCSI